MTAAAKRPTMREIRAFLEEDIVSMFREAAIAGQRWPAARASIGAEFDLLDRYGRPYPVSVWLLDRCEAEFRGAVAQVRSR